MANEELVARTVQSTCYFSPFFFAHAWVALKEGGCHARPFSR